MNSLIARDFPFIIPVFVIATWLAASSVLGLLSGWYKLMATYPDRNEPPIMRIPRQSGTMGAWIAMNGILTLSVCPSGLRVGMMRVFGPFSREFLVPWEDIVVTRRTLFVWPIADLQFGNPLAGKLSISGELANRLARAAERNWPEVGPFPAPGPGLIFRGLLAQWAVITIVAALFFTLVPLAVAPKAARPPLVVAVLFPAIFFGIVFLVRFLFRRR